MNLVSESVTQTIVTACMLVALMSLEIERLSEISFPKITALQDKPWCGIMYGVWVAFSPTHGHTVSRLRSISNSPHTKFLSSSQTNFGGYQTFSIISWECGWEISRSKCTDLLIATSKRCQLSVRISPSSTDMCSLMLCCFLPLMVKDLLKWFFSLTAI